MIGDCVIIAQTMTARGIMTALLATDGSQYAAGAVVRCQRYGSITERNTVTAIVAIWSFLKMDNDTQKQIEDALNAIGAVIEISRFMLIKMQEEGYTYDEAFSTAQEYIFKSLKI